MAAERPAVRVQPMTRDKLSRALGPWPELIRALENLAFDVSETLPDAAQANADAAAAAQNTAAAARVIAEEALSEVEQAQLDADTARAIAGAAAAIAQAAADASEIAHHLLGQVAEQRDTIAGLVRRIEDLENRP